VRYEASVDTRLAFHGRGFAAPLADLRPETVLMQFEGRRFVWHANKPDDEGTEYFPTVTTMMDDGDEYSSVRGQLERFLSALAFSTGTPAEVFTDIGAGPPGEMDPARLRQPRRGLATYLSVAPAEVRVEDDDRLRVVLAYYRDGLNTRSPFFSFLGFWNALDVACEDYQGRLPQWVGDSAAPYWDRHHVGAAPDDIWDYLRASSRNAVAHAIPRDVPALDPDDPQDRVRLGGDAGLVRALVEARVRERWGNHVVSNRY
jgi:hypothetical protein